MSYLFISDLIEDGKNALSAGCYWAALSVALMLPSVCSRLEFSNDPQYFSEGAGKKKYHDKKMYEDWCKKYLKNDSLIKSLLENVPENLYALRCDLIHAGCARMFSGTKAIYFSTNDGIVTTLPKRDIVDVKGLCEFIFDNVEIWEKGLSADNQKHTFVFKKNNRDDDLLYKALCDEARLSAVRKEFDEYEQSNANNDKEEK